MNGWLKGVYLYRHFLASSIRNELVNQFARSRLGGLWLIIHPLVMVAIYAFVLSAVLSAKFDGIDNRYAYAIYLTSGILAWTLFSDTLSRCLNLFVGNGDLLKKMRIPKVTLPLITAGTVLINNLVLFAAIIVIFAFLGHAPTMTIVWMPVITGVLLLFALGLGVIIGVLNVFLRDLAQVVPIVLQFLFWFTPIVYPVVIIPEDVRGFLFFNPVYLLVNAYHDVLAYQQSPNLFDLGILGLIGAVLLVLGLWLVRKANAEMVDKL
ncbi:ABC transporter permease [Marinobacter sp. F3R08]|uniref:ABC transporter permease n=1 Tax=Marinobacter sp. F3R08 TaxID=2841559 RepID=UPI001C096D87|nr:ABC transporter permease [Marinobacter sp. F3R08]MBU2954466.1 ABC transporter permease [Marinobacter sp. F3R08]